MFKPLFVASRTRPPYQYIISSHVFALLLGKTRRHSPSSLFFNIVRDGLGLCVKHEKQTGFSFIVFTNE